MGIRTGNHLIDHAGAMGGPGNRHFVPTEVVTQVRDAGGSTAVIITQPSLAEKIDANTVASRRAGIDASIETLKKRRVDYENQKNGDLSPYWEGCLDTTDYLIGMLEDLRGQHWEPGQEEAEAAPVLKANRVPSPWMIKAPPKEARLSRAYVVRELRFFTGMGLIEAVDLVQNIHDHPGWFHVFLNMQPDRMNEFQVAMEKLGYGVQRPGKSAQADDHDILTVKVPT